MIQKVSVSFGMTRGDNMEEKKCKYLNVMYGEGRYLCMWELKSIGNAKRCETCKYHTEREKEEHG